VLSKEGAHLAIVHLNAMKFNPGDVVSTGSFGLNLRKLHKGISGSDGRVYVLGMVAREYIFELVRRDLRPTAPSRLTCAFACPTEEDARLYAGDNNPGDRLRFYEVEPLDVSAATHNAAISHCTMTSDVSFIDLMEEKARLYWEGAPGDRAKGREVLFSCPLRVLRPL
jgi:Protein of unknown function (DUF2441)